MGKSDKIWNDYGRRISKVIFGFVEYFFKLLFGLVYGGPKESMPPIKDLLLLDSAVTIAMKIRTRKPAAIKTLSPKSPCSTNDELTDLLEKCIEIMDL